MMKKDDEQGMSRRALLQSAGAGTVALASAGAVSCASLPKVGKREGKHPCSHRYCRYYRKPARGASKGHCALAIREQGGRGWA